MKSVSAQAVSCCVYDKPQKYAAHAWQFSKSVWKLGWSCCSSPSTKDLHEPSIIFQLLRVSKPGNGTDYCPLLEFGERMVPLREAAVVRKMGLAPSNCGHVTPYKNTIKIKKQWDIPSLFFVYLVLFTQFYRIILKNSVGFELGHADHLTTTTTTAPIYFFLNLTLT